MPDYPIDLGKSMKDCPIMAEPPSKEEKNKKYYPSLYLDWDSKYDLPDSGEMTIRFKKTSETTRTDREGDQSQSVSLDILSIESVEEDSAEETKESRGDSLDRIAKKGKYSETDEED